MTTFTAIVISLILAVIFILLKYRRTASPPASPSRVTSRQACDEAYGRSIVVGEHHADREGVRAVLSLMREAHGLGYRTLGIEMSEDGRGEYRGLREEIAFLSQFEGALPEYDMRSYLEHDATGKAPRFNRHWHIREALRLGWKIVPIDPFHWNHQSDDEYGYITSREPAMAEMIRAHGPMVAVVGVGHLLGLHRLLGDTCIMVTCRELDLAGPLMDTFWAEPIRFAATLPRLAA